MGGDLMAREWDVPGYTEVKTLGSGGFGDVVLARHDGSGSQVAIKYLRRQLLADAKFAELFRAEAAVQASLEPDRPYVYPARCFVTGRIGGSAVGCLSAEQQVYFHQGYGPKDRDRHDMAQLRAAFGVDTHF